MATVPPSPDHMGLVSYIVSALQALGAIAVLVLGWLWSRMNRSQDELLRAHVRITKVEKELLEHKAEVGKEYATRQEVRSILEDVTKPIRDSAERTEGMVDELFRLHMKKDT